MMRGPLLSFGSYWYRHFDIVILVAGVQKQILAEVLRFGTALVLAGLYLLQEGWQAGIGRREVKK